MRGAEPPPELEPVTVRSQAPGGRGRSDPGAPRKELAELQRRSVIALQAQTPAPRLHFQTGGFLPLPYDWGFTCLLHLIRNSSSHTSEWPLLASPNRLETQTRYMLIQGTGIHLLHPIWEILLPPSDLLRASYAPNQLGLISTPHQTEETFVS